MSWIFLPLRWDNSRIRDEFRGAGHLPRGVELGKFPIIPAVDLGPCCTSRAGLWARLGAMLDLVGRLEGYEDSWQRMFTKLYYLHAF